jgi:ATP-dependent Clp protease ATP-binding subunit ClpB
MRFDKLTTKFQQALAEAQSLALGLDATQIEPQHLLMALLDQEDGGTKSLLQRAGVNVGKLTKDLQASIERLPRQHGSDGNINIGRDLNSLLNLTDKEATKRGDQFIASELFLLALANDKSETGRILKDAGASARACLRKRQKVSGKRLKNTPLILLRVRVQENSIR